MHSVLSEVLHGTANGVLCWPPRRVKSLAGDEVANAGWKTKASLGLPPWLTFSTWILPYQAKAEGAQMAQAAHASARAMIVARVLMGRRLARSVCCLHPR